MREQYEREKAWTRKCLVDRRLEKIRGILTDIHDIAENIGWKLGDLNDILIDTERLHEINKIDNQVKAEKDKLTDLLGELLKRLEKRLGRS